MIVENTVFTWRNVQKRDLVHSNNRLCLSGVRLGDEYLMSEFSSDGCAVIVTFYSPRPQEMLDRIQKIAFPTFEPQPLREYGFGYRATFRIL